MTEFIVQIRPKKQDFDPLAKQVFSQLVDNGENPDSALVKTERLYKLKGRFSGADIKTIIDQLLVDPVVETGRCLKEEKKSKESTKGGFVVDVWPKPGVTDPVGETVEKGLMDLGFSGEIHAASAHRYIFPKLSDKTKAEQIARQFLANELINDIIINKAGSGN